MNPTIFHLLPLWLDFLVFFGLLVFALELGNYAGFRLHRNRSATKATGRNAFLNSMFGILGLLLAFTFGSGFSYHLNRQEAVVAEANALGTAFQRAGLVPEPGRSELRTGLLDYARTRAAEHGKPLGPEELGALIEKSITAQNKLWPSMEAILESSPRGPVEVALATSVNDVINADTNRMAAIIDTVPPVIIFLLLAIATATGVMEGFNSGLSGRMNRWQTTTLALVLASILLVIVDFDRSRDGLIRVRQDSIRSVMDQMNAMRVP